MRFSPFAGILLLASYAAAQSPHLDVPYVPSPNAVVDGMLKLAKVTKADVVYDLGSGDGRMVIAAAKRGAHAHGVEYNPQLIEVAQRAAVLEGVSHEK